MTTFRRLFLFLLLFLLLGSPARAAEDFGAWSAQPGQAGTNAFDSSLDPFPSAGLAERLSWACVDRSGKAITASEREYLTQIFVAAADVYGGEFEFGSEAALSSGAAPKTTPRNGGYPEGRQGMEEFLQDERRILRQGNWTPYLARSLVRSDAERGEKVRLYPASQAGWKISLGEGRGTIRKREGARLAGLLPVRASTPLALSENLPEGCGLQPIEQDEPTLQSQLLHPGDFLLDQLLYVPGKIANSGFEFIQPHAFAYTFYTAHTERGDLMWQNPASCKPASSESRYLSRAQISDSCASGKPLGWSKSAYESPGRSSWFISAARLLQWLVSGAYLLILFAAAVAYMYRGHRDNSIGVLRIMPRIILSIFLTLTAGIFIGFLVSLSNLLVQVIFDFSTSRPIGSLNSILLHAGHVVGGPDLIQRIVELVTSSAAVFFYFVFVVFSLVRQILLVALVILAPVAAMCLIVPRWRRHFATWFRVLMVCLFSPVALAAILKIGMSINPLVINPKGAYGETEGFLGLVLMMVTLWLMYRAIRVSVDYARRGGPVFQPLLQQGERLLSPGKDEKDSENRGNLVPGERAALVGASDPRAGNLIAAPQGAAGALGAAPVPVASLPPGRKEEIVRGFQEGRRQESLQAGSRRVSQEAARAWREGLISHLRAAEQKAGRKLRKSEVQKARQEYENSAAGKLEKQGGAWHITHAPPPVGESPA